MSQTVFSVEGMSCQHCVKAVTGAVSGLPGVAGVSVDLERGLVTVEHDPAQTSADKLRSEIEDQGYDVVS
ncbi:Copper chaperone CopZ [bioreactor metagenome]|uniref:Copper chaperone CopZ n=1 Tax=bioreactor metagenome TaxID=1076179 RepID=A0A645HJF2_9ZZZZ